jgi:large subunit ribosomal protein L16
LKTGYVSHDPLKAIIRLFKWFSKICKLEDEHIFYRLHIFPDFVLTSKPKEVRMGKGKGAPSSKVCFVKKGQIIFQLWIRDLRYRNLVLLLLRKMIYKLPFKSTISFNSW